MHPTLYWCIRVFQTFCVYIITNFDNEIDAWKWNLSKELSKWVLCRCSFVSSLWYGLYRFLQIQSFPREIINKKSVTFPRLVNKYTRYSNDSHPYIYIYIQGVPGGMCQNSGGVPCVKINRYNPKHLCPKLNGYGDKDKRKVWSSCGSTYCTWFAWRNTHTLRIFRPCLQPVQARSSLRLHM